MAYKCLPRPQFSTLQQNIFPVFFTMQTILPLIMICTYPGEKLLGIGGEYVRENMGLSGVMAESNRWTVLFPLATILITSAANLFVVGPSTTKTMKQRHHQGKLTTYVTIEQTLLIMVDSETRDGKKSYDKGPHSDEMQKLNKAFGTLHGVSTLLNLSGLGAMIYYAWVLGSKL